MMDLTHVRVSERCQFDKVVSQIKRLVSEGPDVWMRPEKPRHCKASRRQDQS